MVLERVLLDNRETMMAMTATKATNPPARDDSTLGGRRPVTTLGPPAPWWRPLHPQQNLQPVLCQSDINSIKSVLLQLEGDQQRLVREASGNLRRDRDQVHVACC